MTGSPTHPFVMHLIKLYSDVIEEDIATRAQGLSESDIEAIFQQMGLQFVARSQCKPSKTRRSKQLH